MDFIRVQAHRPQQSIDQVIVDLDGVLIVPHIWLMEHHFVNLCPRCHKSQELVGWRRRQVPGVLLLLAIQTSNRPCVRMCMLEVTRLGTSVVTPLWLSVCKKSPMTVATSRLIFQKFGLKRTLPICLPCECVISVVQSDSAAYATSRSCRAPSSNTSYAICLGCPGRPHLSLLRSPTGTPKF